MPAWVDEAYLARYGDDPTLFPNMNVSPDFPVAARLWMESYEAGTGRSLDGAIGIDVTAIGAMLEATGVTLTGPDGRSISGAEFADFALAGIYELFPTGADSAARKAYQEVLAGQAIEAVLAAGDPVPLVRAIAEQVGQRRLAVWTTDEPVQRALADTPLAQTLGEPGSPAAAHSVQPAVINIGWSKLDTYLDRGFRYEVGRCPDAMGAVRSDLVMTFTSDLPSGALPEYVVGAVPVGPSGPVNRVVLQAHLPPGAEVLEVEVDGESSEYFQFLEAGRPAMGYILELEPGVPVEVAVQFREPASAVPGEVVVQPLARDAAVSVVDRAC
jgi:hypothetical protein